MPNLPRRGLDGLHHEAHAREDLRREVLHQLEVLVQQRFALGSVGDDELHLAAALTEVGKPAPPAPTTPHRLELLLRDPWSRLAHRASRAPVLPVRRSPESLSRSAPVSIIFGSGATRPAPCTRDRSAAGRSSGSDRTGAEWRREITFSLRVSPSESRNFTSTESLWRMADGGLEPEQIHLPCTPKGIRPGFEVPEVLEHQNFILA